MHDLSAPPIPRNINHKEQPRELCWRTLSQTEHIRGEYVREGFGVSALCGGMLCQKCSSYGVAQLWAERQRKADYSSFTSSQWLLLVVPGCPVWTDLPGACRTTPSDYLQNQFQSKFKTLWVFIGYFCIISPWQGYMSSLPFLPALLRWKFCLPTLLSGYWNKPSLKHLVFRSSLVTTSVTDKHMQLLMTPKTLVHFHTVHHYEEHW